MLGQWVPPIALPPSTSPAPGSGYESSSWQQELAELIGAVAHEAQTAIYQPPAPPPPPPPAEATIMPALTSRGVNALVLGAVAVGALLFLSRR